MPVKNEEETYEKIIEMNNNKDYTTGKLLDFGYLKENYKLIATDLSKQTKLKDLQQINFTGKLQNQDHGATMFFIIKKIRRNYFKFFTKFRHNHINNGNTKDCEFIKRH